MGHCIVIKKQRTGSDVANTMENWQLEIHPTHCPALSIWAASGRQSLDLQDVQLIRTYLVTPERPSLRNTVYVQSQVNKITAQTNKPIT